MLFSLPTASDAALSPEDLVALRDRLAGEIREAPTAENTRRFMGVQNLLARR